jgi:formate--tetrahydrofolate ligase
MVEQRMKKLGVNIVLASHWGEGGKGAADLARMVVDLCESDTQKMQYVYEDADTLWEKINKIAKKVYRASEVTADAKVKAQIENLQKSGYGHYPVCVAKTQSSFSTDAKLRGAPDNHTIAIREVRLAAGAEFVVMVCGDIMTMPGLPKVPSAEKIDYVDGKVVGLF